MYKTNNDWVLINQVAKLHNTWLRNNLVQKYTNVLHEYCNESSESGNNSNDKSQKYTFVTKQVQTENCGKYI